MNKIDISHRIEHYFNKLGWTKKKFAEAIDEYPQNLNKVFEGKLDPLNYIESLVELGCDINWLLTGEEKIIVKEKQVDYFGYSEDETGKKLTEHFLTYTTKLEDKVKLLEARIVELETKLINKNNEKAEVKK